LQKAIRAAIGGGEQYFRIITTNGPTPYVELSGTLEIIMQVSGGGGVPCFLVADFDTLFLKIVLKNEKEVLISTTTTLFFSFFLLLTNSLHNYFL
jgi:hypothetical protein